MSTNPYLSFADRLRMVRKDAGLSQAQIAAKTHQAKSEISNYECGTYPSFWNLCQLANVLNVSLDYLCGLTDERRPLRVES